MTLVALDTNILVYFAGVIRVDADVLKVHAIEQLLEALDRDERIAIPAQVLGECYNVLTKAGADRGSASKTIKGFCNRYPIVGGGAQSMRTALELATSHRLQIWDALIVVSAQESGCSFLLSEDMQDGFIWNGITIINPFGERCQMALFG